ncbi:hypothetical protein [Bacillus wiedmannii]|uniref:hypothetical protein n=1 Tax=Bacillus wiedmannii TaxID=1890302 RepID=UPI002E1B7DDB|nr:hypothetical protein [Bacillus wiedmannii]
MFLQKYKGLIIGVIGAVIGILSFFYLKDLDYMYRLGLRLFSITLITIGWIIVENSNHFYKKRIMVMYRCYYSQIFFAFY